MIEYTQQNIMQWSRLGMRKAYGAVLCHLADNNPKILSMAADVVDSANLYDFAERFPDRQINAGISEQNMVAMAAGLAKESYNVFVTSFAPFVSLRVYEAIRTLICYMNLNVKMVALSSGFSLGVQGATHYALEDISIMRSIPNLLVLSPADTTEMAKAMEYLAEYDGPAYLRLTGLPGSALAYKKDYEYDVNGISVIREGSDVGIFATGTLVGESVRASRLLSKNGISAGVINLSTLNPINADAILAECSKYKLIVTAEEHNITGGIGSILSEVLATMSSHPRLVRMGSTTDSHISGNYAYMMETNKLTAKDLVEMVGIEFQK